jgi:glycosyltransferase involved in cell wall biosynthesis
LLFETGNARQLADSIRRLIEDVELRSKLRQNGVRTVQERFSEQVMMDQYEQLYAEAMELKQWRAMKV